MHAFPNLNLDILEQLNCVFHPILAISSMKFRIQLDHGEMFKNKINSVLQWSGDYILILLALMPNPTSDTI